MAGNIDAAYFYWAVIQSMEALVNDVYNAVAGQGNEPEILSMDGKESRGYVAALKGNHPLFYKEVQEYFWAKNWRNWKKIPGHYKKTAEKEHSGIAIREYYQTDETWWYEDKKKWKGLATFGMVKKKLEKPDGKTMDERRYYISSLP